jgi:hypothetical protein
MHNKRTMPGNRTGWFVQLLQYHVAVTARTQRLLSVQRYGSHCRRPVHGVLSAQALLVLAFIKACNALGILAAAYAMHVRLTCSNVVETEALPVPGASKLL